MVKLLQSYRVDLVVMAGFGTVVPHIVDAFPDLRDGMIAAIRAAGIPDDVGLAVADHHDHALAGARFLVDEKHHRGADAHRHTSFREIRSMLERAPLEAAVRDRAVAIFTLLAQAEGKVHGMAAEQVSFHELGEWDSIANIVGAA